MATKSDLEAEIAQLKERISELEDENHSLNNSVDYHTEEENKALERIDKLESEIEEILEKTKCDTMVGELKFETNNLLDAHTMELVTELMQKVLPVKLIEILQNTLKGIDLL